VNARSSARAASRCSPTLEYAIVLNDNGFGVWLVKDAVQQRAHLMHKRKRPAAVAVRALASQQLRGGLGRLALVLAQVAVHRDVADVPALAARRVPPAAAVHVGAPVALARVDLADRPLDRRRGEAHSVHSIAPCSATASASVSPDSSGSQLISVVMRSEWQPVEA
jgi:hypothetical protein